MTTKLTKDQSVELYDKMVAVIGQFWFLAPIIEVDYIEDGVMLVFKNKTGLTALFSIYKSRKSHRYEFENSLGVVLHFDNDEIDRLWLAITDYMEGINGSSS